MKAAVLAGPGQVRVEEVPDPEPTEGEVIVAVKACGICGSDLDGFRGVIPHRRPVGIIMGHEAAGVVVALGRGVDSVELGARVAVDPQLSCGRCDLCLARQNHLCDSLLGIGSAMRGYRNGANAEFVSVPVHNVYPLPDEVSFVQGAMAEPVGNAVHLVKRGGVRPGASVAVFGAGTQGLFAIQAASRAGAQQIFSIDLSSDKLRLADDLGATRTIHPPEEDPLDVLLDETNGRGVDVAIECVGLEITYRQALLSLAKRGTLAGLGNLDEEITLPLGPVIYRELNIVGSTGFFWPEDPAIERIADGSINVDLVISHRFALEEAQSAYETAAEAESVKVMLVSDDA